MPAPDLDTLQDFETQLDSALAAILAPLAAGPYGFQVLSQHSNEDLLAPRCVYSVALDDAAARQDFIQQRPAPAAECAVGYGFTFSLQFVFDPTKTDFTALKLRGLVRRLFLPRSASFNATVLPWLLVLTLGTTRAIRGKISPDEATWDIDYAGSFSIRADAWPS